MKLLITGAGGFIGRHTVVEARAAGHDVLWWGNPPKGVATRLLDGVRRLTCSFDAPDAARHLNGVDAVIHLAGRYPRFGLDRPSPLELFRANADLTAKLLDTCARAATGRFVLASTAGVYGAAPVDIMEETFPLNGRTPYAASKICAETLVRTYTANGGPGGISLRLFNTYGPGQPADNVFATIARQALRDGPVRVHDDRPVRDFIQVADVARALVAAATHAGPLPEAINIGSGRGTSVRELATRIMRAAGRSDALQVTESSDSAGDRVMADIGLAKQVLGWQPSVGLEQGIGTVLDALRQEMITA